MEKFWKWLANTANKELTKRELKRRAAGIYNRLDALSGEVAAGFSGQAMELRSQVAEEISDQFSSAGPLIVQRVTDHMNKISSDNIVVTRDLIDEATKYSERCSDRNNTLLASIMGRVLVALNNLSNKSEKRQNHVMEAFNELARQAAIHDQNNSDRYLSLIEQFRQLKTQVDLSQGITLSLIETIRGEVKANAQPKQRYDAAPNLQWLFDNIDNIQELGSTLELARQNHIPRHAAKMELIRKIRMLNLYSITSVSDEVERLQASWDNDQSFCAAA